MENILIIRLKSIGDVILTLPAVHAIRESFPSAKITFLTSQENSSLLQGFSEVDDVIVLDRAKMRGGNPFKIVSGFLHLLRQLRGGKFSHAVDLQGYGETAWLTRLTGAPERWSTIYKTSRAWAYTRTLARNPVVHATDAHLDLLRHCGVKVEKTRYEFTVPPDAQAAARKIFADNHLAPAKPVLFIQPFTNIPHKNWPLENYLAVARYWRERGLQIVFGGGPADRSPLQAAAAEGFCVTAGVPLLVTAGLLQLSSFVLGGDTGMLHLAVALGKRVLMLMHDVRPGSPAPYQHADWAMAAPATVSIHLITVAQVNAALEPHLTSR
jgi:ADP-heptose:LPS heptosyltransferase